MSAGPPPAGGDALVTVIVPAHDHASTVDLAVQSVLLQSVSAVQVVVIGDGATTAMRRTVTSLMADARVRFIDHRKTASRAESVRHRVLLGVRTPYVCYLGDDDVMLPGHLEKTITRLQNVDFTHPLPVFIDGDGVLRARFTDLADERCRRWHLHPFRNAVSLTGVGHRLDAYRRLAHGWREPPSGRWSDHYMWQQWFRTPGLRYSTGPELTVLKFAAGERAAMTAAERRAEIEAWLRRAEEPGFARWLTAAAACASARAGVELRLELDHVVDQHELTLESSTAAVAHAQAAAAHSRAEAEAARCALRALEASRLWRLRDWVIGRPPGRWLARGRPTAR